MNHNADPASTSSSPETRGQSAADAPVSATGVSETVQFGAWLIATAGLAPSTVRAYTGHLADYQRWWQTSRLDVAPTTGTATITTASASDVEAYLAYLTRRGLVASTRRTALHALRAYYRWLHRQEPDVSDRPQNPAALVRRPRVAKPRTLIYTDPDAAAILARAQAHGSEPEGEDAAPTIVAPGHLSGLDHAVLATLRWTGVRSAELRGLTLDDLDLASRLLHVHGKGSKHRQLPLPVPLVEVLDRYLSEVRPTLLHAEVSTRLFCNPRSPAAVLSSRALLEICRRHGTAAGIAGVHTPMRWRHTFATATLARGVDLHTVSRLLGHASTTTTDRYLHLVTADLTTAIDRAYP